MEITYVIRGRGRDALCKFLRVDTCNLPRIIIITIRRDHRDVQRQRPHLPSRQLRAPQRLRQRVAPRQNDRQSAQRACVQNPPTPPSNLTRVFVFLISITTSFPTTKRTLLWRPLTEGKSRCCFPRYVPLCPVLGGRLRARCFCAC